MTQKIGIITGIPGVGKTWLLEKVRTTAQMQVLSAGRMIYDALTVSESEPANYDELRNRKIDVNQTMLIDAFHHRRDQNARLVLLDAHVIIDTPNGLVRVDPGIFARLNANFIVFVGDDPEQIYKRRARDTKRSRPLRRVEHLRYQQDNAESVARDLANSLQLPLYFVTAGDALALEQVLIAEAGGVSDD